MTEEQNPQNGAGEHTAKAPIKPEAITFALNLLEVSRSAEILKLEKDEEADIEQQNLPEAHYYQLLANIDLSIESNNMAFREGIMLLVDAITHTNVEKHPEIVVAGEEETNAEIQLVAAEKDILENIDHDKAKDFLESALKNAA